MFRKPREVANSSSPLNEPSPLPSIGRPPTPPSASQSRAMTSYTADTAAIVPLIGRNSPNVSKKTRATGTKDKVKSNGNIMNFFKKAESDGNSHAGLEEASLFLDPIDAAFVEDVPGQTPTPPQDTPLKSSVLNGDDFPTSASPSSRYNEDEGSVKRRKTEDGTIAGQSEIATPAVPTNTSTGPFLDDSDYEVGPDPILIESLVRKDSIESVVHNDMKGLEAPCEAPFATHNSSNAPYLERESTSITNFDEYDGIEDFIDAEFPEEGEEFMERRFMEEQAEMENVMEEDEELGGDNRTNKSTENCAQMLAEDAATSICPICGGNTTGMSEQQVSVHVNDCLDGKAMPLPPNEPKMQSSSLLRKPELQAKVDQPIQKRFQRAAIARPGQENPFNFSDASISKKGSSAFSKLMTGHAEDTAWASAAAAETASRGKPAYQRTCPFYKIMPGFYICVDAFRYGAVQGCNAYFLSHFHSDHYIGLTSSWCHGPIYCSRVTGNLVRRQLRVDPKWVVDLRFEQRIEVPNTQGVEVTMIPANHCPGSSLFLFEKPVGQGKNPKTQRVLHCGDFRACPAHVQHPKLRPEFLDDVTGKFAHQKIDVCYLDTTYLTPKYAFPSQENVIRACANMCVSLSNEIPDENDGWERVKRERAGEGMVKFVRKTSIKEESTVTSDPDIKLEGEDHNPPPPTTSRKSRGRLLVIVGTYSIGKERICLGVAKALNSKIYAPPSKQKIVAALEDPELSALMTSDPHEAQVHMQMLMEIRAETLADYLVDFKPHFSRIVGFRPSGWNYRPPNSRFTESPSVQTVLFSDNWKSAYSMHDLTPQRGSTSQAMCFGVPYSEHSSFRELTMFCCALRIDKIIPTVNVGSAKSREKMKGWCEKWGMEKKRNGLFKVGDGVVEWS